MSEEEIEHNCYLSVGHTLHDVYSMSESLGHRGKDSTGLFAIGPNGIDVLKWRGPVTNFGNKALQKIFPAERYHTFGMHGRYRSRGSREINLDEGHPHTMGGVSYDYGDHVHIRGCNKILIHNGHIEEIFLSKLDRSGLKTNSDSEALLHYYSQFGIESLIRDIYDGYTLAIADINQNGVIIARGRSGLKPGVYGSKDGFDLFASESVALREIRATLKGDILPGAIYRLKSNGKIGSAEKVVEPVLKHCMFEYQYIAHPHSILNRLNVMVIRQDLGEQLAEEFNPRDADFVTYNPESPKEAAQTYADKLNLPLIECFYKVNGDRSFQAPTQQAREKSIGSNLHILPWVIPEIKGKVGINIDDSFVRGTVVRRARYLLNEVGEVKKSYHLSYTPQIGGIGKDGIERGCDFGGVDMPSKENENHNFLVRGRTLDEINKLVGAEVYFISMEGFKKVYEKRGMNIENLCTFCIGGPHPFRDLK